MVAIVSGNSLGLSLGSLATLGGRGGVGSAQQGRNGESAYVNVANGNLVLQDLDDRLVGRGLDIATVRTYNSQGLFDDDNGDNWRVGAHGQKVVLTGTAGTAGSTLARTDRDGATAVYAWSASRNLYVSSAGAGAFDTIAYDAANARYVWTDGSSGLVERYDASGQGRLLFAVDPNGNTVSYSYNANGTLKSVVDANGEATYFDYTGTNLTQVRTVATGGATLTRVRYAYDGANRLSSVTVDLSPEDNSVADGKTYVTTYNYDGTSKRVASVTQSDGTALAFTYVLSGSSYKVATVTDALGQITRFAYDSASSTTTVTDPQGARSTFLYDADGNLLQVRQGVTAGNAAGLSQVSYRYDAAGNVTGMTDGEGRELAYEYDANGNLLKEVDSAGNTHTRTYNSANQLLSDTIYADASVSRGVFSKDAALPETTRYVYAPGNALQLRFVVTAQGNVTEHRYDSYGQRISTIRYVGSAYGVSTLGTTDVPTQAQMLAWLGGQDPSRTERVDYAYDARGSLSSATTYGEVDATGAGTTATAARTQYVYDQHGNLLQKIEPSGGGTTTYVYDGLGRVLSVSAPSLDGVTANTTVTSYDDAGGRTSVTVASGLVSISAYDKAGRLVSVTQQSAGSGVLGTTTYAYDKNGNLLMTQDPTGVRKWMLYDEANRKIAEIDATGALVEYVYNASGQLRQSVAYATKLTAQKLAQLLDGAGKPTTAWAADNTTTSLATLRPATAAQDQRVWRFYDNVGRLTWQVDALGYVTQTTYDGASRILAVTQLAKPIDVAPLLKGANIDLGVDPSTLGGISLSVNNAESTSYGLIAVLTASVDGAGLRGMVTFFDGETVIGSAVVVDGKATLATDRMSIGTHNLRVAYSGDDLRPASVSKAVKKTITPILTTATLGVQRNPSAGSRSVILSVDVKMPDSAGDWGWLMPSGQITFYAGNKIIGSIVLSNGFGNLVVNDLPEGMQTLRAEYSGDILHAPTVSTPRIFSAKPIPTEATLTSSKNVDGSSTLTARITVPAGSTYLPTGSVTFYSGQSVLGISTLVDGRATFKVNQLGATGPFTVAYAGNVDYAASANKRSPTSLIVSVDPWLPTTNLLNVRLHVAGVGYGATGALYIFGGNSVGLGTGYFVNAEGTTNIWVERSALIKAGGILNIAYTGDSKFQSCILSLKLNLSPSLNPERDAYTAFTVSQQINQSIGVSESFAGFNPAITVKGEGVWDDRFYFDGQILTSTVNHYLEARGLADPDTARLPVNLAKGLHDLTVISLVVEQTDDLPIFIGQRSSQSIAITRTKSQVNLFSSKQSVGAGESVTLTAAIQATPNSPNIPRANGAVTFCRNGIAIGTGTLMNGVATLSIGSLPVGTAKFTASYAGDDNYLASQTTADSWVQVAGSPVVLTNLTTPVIAKDGALSVRVVGKTAATGLVSFYSGMTLLGTVAVTAHGTATLRGVPIPAGTHTFSAAYSGDEANADGAITFTQTVEGTPDTPRVLVGLDITQDRTVTQLLNRNGQVQGTLDAEGYLTEYKYNAAGEQVQSIRYANRAANFASVSARLMAVAIARASGDLAGVRPAASDGDIRTYTFYNARGQAVGQVDGEGYLTETVYDARGNVTQTRRYASLARNPGSANATLASVRPDPSAQDQSITQTWSAANQLLSRTNAEGTVTTFTYDVAGRLVQTTTAAGTPDERIQRLRYDIQGHLIAELDGRGSDAVALNAPLASWSANGSTHAYDAAGRRTGTTDANGHRTLFFYDAFGRLAYTVNALGEVTESRYNAYGQVSEQIVYGSRIDLTPLGTATPGGLNTDALKALLATMADPAKDTHVLKTYNASGTLTSSTDAMGGVTSYAYNAFREAIASSRTRLSGQVITNTVTFDRRGLQVSTTSDATGAGLTRRTGYDAFGRPDTRIDGNGNTASLRYDRLGRVVATTDATGATRTTTYDAFDRVLTQRDALNNVTSYAYSVANRSVTVTTPEGVSVTTLHNRQGQTTSVTDGRGNTTTYSYDKSGNLLRTQAPEGVGTSTTYDKIGLKLSTTDARGTVTTYGYDAVSRLLTRTVDPGGLTLVTSYLYDAKGQTISVTDPGGTVTTTAYDLNGQVVRQTLDPSNGAYVGLKLETVYTHDSDGTALSVHGPDGRLTRYTYDGAGRRIKEQVDPLGLNLTRSYAYDAEGNVIKAVDASGNATLFIYDQAKRLAFTIDAMGGVQQSGYDAEGRLSSQTTYAAFVPVAAWNGTAPSLSAMQAALPTLGLAATQSRRYDRDGRLRFAVDATGAVVEYRYDDAGNVVESRAYAQRIELGKWHGAIDPPVVADDAHDQRSRSVYDALGRKTHSIDGTGAVVRQVFDASGNVTERFAYSKRVPAATAATTDALAAAVALVAEPARDPHDTYVYDRAGRQLLHTDGVGKVTSQNYDKSGNIISRAYINDQPAGTNLFTHSEFANGLRDTENWIGAVRASQMEGFAGALRIGVDPREGYAGAYKLHQSLTLGATYTMSVVVEMEDGLPPSFGSTNARDAANSFAFASLGRMADPLAYTVQHLGGKQYRVATTGVASGEMAYFGVVKFTSNDPRPLRVTGYQLEQTDVASNITPTTATPVLIAAKTQSQVTRFAYDSAGRLVYTLGPLGQLEKNSYDGAGRITLTTRYARPVSTKGLGAAPTVAQLQALASQTPGQDQQQFNVYDQGGRLSATVDAMGSVVTFKRDGNGSVSERTAWANTVDMNKWAPDTAPVPKADTARDQHTRIFYDAMGRETLTIDALGYAVQRQYDAQGRPSYVVRYPVAVPASTPNTQKAKLDAAIALASVSGRPLQITAYGYDAAGNRTSQTEALGQPEAATTQYVFDGIGRLTRTIDARGVELSQSDSAWALTQRLQLKYVNAAGGALKASDLSQAQRQALAARYTTTIDYDAAGHKLSVTDALGGVTRSDYDANGRVVRITDPRGNSAFYYFDAAGRVTLSVDPEGYATATTYDALGHTLSVKRHFNRVSGTYKIAQPPALPGANPSDALTRFEYDASGRLTRTIDAQSNAERYTYNALGQRETLTNKLGGLTAYTYDQLGRVASETLPITSRNAAGQSVAVRNQYAYDAFGNRATTTEAVGLPEQRVTQFSYDGLNREVEQRQAQVRIYVDGQGWSTIAPTRTRSYDASGNLIAVVEPNGGRTRTWFDGTNRKVAEVSATGTLSTWSYDATGNVMAQRVYGDALILPVGDALPTPVNAANVRLTTYQVDANNRVLSSTIAGIQSGNYDASGHQYNMAVTSDLVNRSFYDANGNVVREHNGKDAATLTWYDRLGQKLLQVDAMGFGVRWERDANGAVLRETRFAKEIVLGSLSESTSVDAVLQKFTPGLNDQITEYSYDRNARVRSESRLNVAYGRVAANGALSEGATSATQRTEYNAMGNKTATIDAQGQRSEMRYDTIGRLLSVQRPGAADFNGNAVRQVTDYELNGLGNVRREIRRGTDNAVESDDEIVRYGYDATGVRTSMTTAKGETVTYGRDANGNTTAQMTDRVDADGAVSRDIVSIAYDAANREARRFTGGRDAADMPVFDAANTITLTYNAWGELASKRTGSGNAQGQAQEYYDYDKAGRLWRTNSKGGVNKAWMYDLAGNATLQLESQRVDLRAMTWDQMAGDGSHPNPDILITITSYDKDNRVVSVMQPKMDAARPNLKMFAAPINVDSGKFGGLDIDVAPALAEANSTWIAGPSDGSATGAVSVLGMPILGGNIRPITNGEAGIPGNPRHVSDVVVGVTDLLIGSAGDWTSNIENIYGAMTWRIEVAGTTQFLGRVTTWPQVVHPMYNTPPFPVVSMYMHRGLAYSGLMPIRVIATVQSSGLDVVVSTGTIRQLPWPTQDQTLSGTFMRLTASEARDTDTIQLYSRPRDSNSPFSQSLPIFKAGQGGSSLNNVAIDGSYFTRLESLGGPTELLLVVTQPDGTVVRRQSIQYDPATRQSSSSVAAAQPVFTTDNVAHFTGMRINGHAIRVLQRPNGSEGEYSQRTYWPAGATGRFEVQFDGGTSDVIIEVLDMGRNVVVDRLKGTVNPGVSYYDMRPLAALPSSITFRDIPIDAQTLQIDYEPLSPGGLKGSITIPRERAGDIAQWVWDAANLIPDKRSLYSYRLHAVARDADGFIMTDITGEATIGALSKIGTKARLTGNLKHQVMTFDPEISEGRSMKLRYRDKGATDKDFTEVAATRVKIGTAFKWDATANGLNPDKEYEFLYDVYNASGAMIGNGEGYFRLNNTTANSDVRWAIPNLPGQDIINHSWVIQRRQEHDAFGRVVKEIDGKENVNDLRYNTLGLLIDKIGPVVDVTLANGQRQAIRPTEHYSYDLNGQFVGKRDANGNQSTVQINAAGQAVAEWHPGATAGTSAVVRKAYDVFGNLRTVTDEIGRVTRNEYDFNNRLKRVERPVNANGSVAVDAYEYDILGQRIAQVNALDYRVRTYYDSMGRVTRYISAEGATVNYGYTYDNSIGSAGGVNTGGWTNTTTDANGRTQTLKNDVFGRTMWKQDLGGHQFTYGYNWSGLIATQTGNSGQNIAYSYYDNGYLRKVSDAGVSTESIFEYDNNGNRIFEGLKAITGNVVFQWSRVSYDAYNRVKTIDDARYMINYEYDANGNRRRVLSTYINVVDQRKDVQDYWYAYDGMNRFTTTMGQMVNGQIWRGASGDGVTIEYDNAGQRKAAIYARDGHREDYDYDGTGHLTAMKMNGVLRSRRTNDLAGRVTRYEELYADQTLSSQKDRTWNKDNQLTVEVERRLTEGTNGRKWSDTTTAYTLMQDGTLSKVDSLTNAFNNFNPSAQDPAVVITRMISNYAYDWWDSAKQTSITLDPVSTGYDPKRPQPPGYSVFGYDVNGHLKTATDLNATTPRSFSYWTNAEGQVLQRQELIGGKIGADGNVSGASKSRDHRYFYFDGKRVGNVGNDGVEREDYAQQLARSSAKQSPDDKYRKFTPTNSADFDENYQPINAGFPGPAPGSYTVREGDTLEGVARALWGDATLWYLLAEANGLDGQPSAALVENTVLQVPNKVTNLHNTSSTFRPYDPGKAMGDTSPTLPDPLPAPKGKGGDAEGWAQSSWRSSLW